MYVADTYAYADLQDLVDELEAYEGLLEEANARLPIDSLEQAMTMEDIQRRDGNAMTMEDVQKGDGKDES